MSRVTCHMSKYLFLKKNFYLKTKGEVEEEIKKIDLTVEQQKEFRVIYNANIAKVTSFLKYRLNSLEDAQDVAELTFTKAARLFPTYDKNLSQINTWLFMIAKSVMIDFIKSNKSKPLSLVTCPPGGTCVLSTSVRVFLRR